MGTRHWPEDADDALEAKDKEITELCVQLARATETIRYYRWEWEMACERERELQEQLKAIRSKS